MPSTDKCNAPHPRFALRCDKPENHQGSHGATWETGKRYTWKRSADGLDGLRSLL